MGNIDTELILIIGCGIVVVSYLFSIIGQYARVPSVLLLLAVGILLRYFADKYNFQLKIPQAIVEGLGVVGLIMIVLEAGLDLKIDKEHYKLIRNSFFSALVILIMSVASVTAILQSWLYEPVINCLVYAIPLSIISSAIVIPSLHHLSKNKKEFLVYEASLSDILGIILFNFFTVNQVINAKAGGIFLMNIVLSVALSVVLSLVLFYIMAKTKLNIKFFLIFSLLILIYATGKLLHLPSLIIILLFGLMINNWEKVRLTRLVKILPHKEIEEVRHLMHSITAESSFLIRTFFFIFFGYSIKLQAVVDTDVMFVGSVIVLALFLIRIFYLRFFLHTNLFPEAFFMPRGLITIVLFYKIPSGLRLSNFNEGILFFVVLCTSLIMSVGMMMYKKRPEQVIEERKFIEYENLY